MKNLNSGENLGQHFKRRKHHQIPEYGERSNFSKKICGIALFVQWQENQWYIDSECSEHMTGDTNKLHSYNSLEKEKNVSSGNDTPTVIKGNGSIYLKENVKARNVMYVYGLKHNSLSANQMCDQGNEVVFQ